MNQQYFDFSGLIADFSNVFTVITNKKGGYDDAGDYQAEQKKRTVMHGAITAYKQSKVYRSEGRITMQDKRLFMQEALPSALIGAEVLYNGQKYKIESETENAKFTGVYSYMLKWTSAFKEGDA